MGLAGSLLLGESERKNFPTVTLHHPVPPKSSSLPSLVPIPSPVDGGGPEISGGTPISKVLVLLFMLGAALTIIPALTEIASTGRGDIKTKGIFLAQQCQGLNADNDFFVRKTIANSKDPHNGRWQVTVTDKPGGKVLRTYKESPCNNCK